MDRFRWLLFALVLAMTTAQAQEELDLERLESLVKAGRMEQAYALADQHSETHAGQVKFDLYYGMAAIDTGHVDVGVFALERVLMQRPGLHQARLEYARGLFLLEDDQRARHQFETVLAQDPPPAVEDRVERYLAAIDRRADSYRTTVTGEVGIELGNDSNVNRAPDARAVDLGIGRLLLDDSSQEISDGFGTTHGRVNLSRPLMPGLNFIASANADLRRHFDESDFNTSQAGASAGLRWSEGNHRLSGSFDGGGYYVGGDAYQNSAGFSAHYRYRLNERSSLHGTARATQLRYEDLEALDSTLTWLGGGGSHSWSGAWNPRASLTLLVGQEEPKESTNRAKALAQRDILELHGSVGVDPAPDWTLKAQLRARSSEYETNTFPFVEAREETYYSLDLRLDWRPDLNWRIGPHVNYAQNESNIDLYDYERTVVGLGARYLFF